ncbi:12397_t:CDS:1, partial [Funneliformis mosseae]
ASNSIKFDWKLPIQMNLLENYASNPSKSASKDASNLLSAYHCT